MLWIVWLCIVSHVRSQKFPETIGNQNFSMLEWIAKMETKHPVHTDSPRSFLGEQQDFQMLEEILSCIQMTENDIQERISWASHIVSENSVEAPRIWQMGQGGKMIEIEVPQKVLCVRMS